MAHKTFFKHDMVPAAIARHDRKKAKRDALEAAYEVVNKRDGNCCRVTGEPLRAECPDAKHRREHHHLRGRNVKPEWRDDPRRIVLVSKLAHDLLTNGWIDCEGDDAEKPLRFHWTALAKSRPFRIKSRRKSQQRAA